MSRDHRKLRAFELADELVVNVYRQSHSFPAEERFGLTSQIRRAAVSVPANIVEGCGRRTHGEYLHMLSIALGSLRELGYYLDLARRLQYIEQSAFDVIYSEYEETARTLGALVRSLESRK